MGQLLRRCQYTRGLSFYIQCQERNEKTAVATVLIQTDVSLMPVGNKVLCDLCDSTGGTQTTCASPEKQAGRDLLQAAAACYPSPRSVRDTEPQKPVNSQMSLASSTTPQTTWTSSQTHNTDKGTSERGGSPGRWSFCPSVLMQHNDWSPFPVSSLHTPLVQTPVLGNTWKFAACVAALALSTSVLIVCAVKGPSLYKLFHNYRHRRLHQEEDDAVPTVFSETERHLNRQTFTFQHEDGQMEMEEEEEDGYFEDPYIKREE